MQNGLLVTEPALLVQNQVARHPSRDEGTRAALRKVRLQRHSPDWSLHVEDV